MSAAVSTVSSTKADFGSVSKTFPLIDRKILIICQGNLPFYQETLAEINPNRVFVVVCQEEESKLRDKKFAVVHYVREFFSSGEVEKNCFNLLKKNNIELIVAPSETDILRAAKLRDLFHLEGQSYKSALFFRDKVQMKSLLRENGIEVPRFTRVTSALDVLEFVHQYPYPFILKPSRGYGSLKTYVLKSEEDVNTLLETKGLFDEFHQTELDLEQFIQAEMYHIDGIVRDGQVLAVWPSRCINNCLQMTGGKPTGGYLLSADNPLVPALNQYAKKVLSILPMPSEGGFHLELFYSKNKFIFCEIASRIGGPWINDLWVKGLDIDLKREFIRAQAHLPSSLKSNKVIPSTLIGGMIFPPRAGKVISIPQACDIKGVIEYTAFVAAGTKLEEPNGMLGHIAAVTLAVASEKEMESTIQSVEKWFESSLEIEAI